MARKLMALALPLSCARTFFFVQFLRVRQTASRASEIGDSCLRISVKDLMRRGQERLQCLSEFLVQYRKVTSSADFTFCTKEPGAHFVVVLIRRSGQSPQAIPDGLCCPTTTDCTGQNMARHPQRFIPPMTAGDR